MGKSCISLSWNLIGGAFSLELTFSSVLINGTDDEILYFKDISKFILFYLQSWTKGWRQIGKIKQKRFFYGMFYSWFFAIFYQKMSKFGIWLDGWVLTIKSKHFKS